MSEAGATIAALSKEFDAHIIQTKPGSKPGASNYKPATKFVSHGSVTKRLNAVCPDWSSRVMQMHTYHDPQGRMQCAGVTLELTIPGVGSREEFGTTNQPRDFGTDAKNAMSDALKRCAMRFGVALDLWEDMDEYDEDAAPQHVNPPARQSRPTPPASSAPRPAVAPTAAAGTPYTKEEYEAAIKVAWQMQEVGDTYPAIVAYMRTHRDRLTPDQLEDSREEVRLIKAAIYPEVLAPASIAG